MNQLNRSKINLDLLLVKLLTFINQQFILKLVIVLTVMKLLLFFADGFYQDQKSWFGQTNYEATQQSVYANLQYDLKWKDQHDFKAGLSYCYFNLNENISFTENPLLKTFAGKYWKHEIIPGVFAENIFNWKDYKYQLITGVRIDKHNKFGYYFTPRTMLKIQPSEKTTVRSSAGTGWRTANIFSENINLLASQRDIIFT